MPPTAIVPASPPADRRLARASAGEVVWLVRHDLRLWIRRLAGALRLRRAMAIAIVLGAAIAMLHALLWPIARHTVALWSFPPARQAVENQVAFAGVVLASIVAASSLRRTIDLIFGKGDFDLLLASPLRPGVIVTARAAALAIGGGGLGALFWAPFADDAARLGGLSWLAIYPAMLATTFLASALGVAAAIGLFALFGPRRARLPAQIAQMLLGLTYFFLGAVGFVVPKDVAAALTRPAPGALLDHGGLLFVPVRAALGDPLALAAWLALAALVFFGATTLLGRRVVGAARAAAAIVARSAKAAPLKAFAAGPRAALAIKERRLARRNPAVLALAAMFVVMAAPVVLQLVRDGYEALPPLAASVIVLFAGQMTIALASMGLAEETAPDLVRTAPLTRRRLLFGKIGAFAPIVAVGVLAPAALLYFVSPLAAGWAALFGFGVAASVTTCVAAMRDSPPRRFAGPQSAITPLVALLLQVVVVSWTLAASLASLGSVVALVPLVFAALALFAAKPRALQAFSRRAARRRSLRRRPWRASSAAAPR